MKNYFLVFVAFFLVPLFAQAQTVPPSAPDGGSDISGEVKPPLPDFIIEKLGFYSLSAGYQQLQAPSGKIDMAQIDLNYLWVNQGIAQLYQLRLGLSGRSQSLALGYGLGLGPRRGIIHVGILLNLGYAHLYDTSKYVHGMVVGVSPMVIATLWKSWQFFLTAGWSMIPLSSDDIPNGRGYMGWNIGFGAAASID
jgi:hypothetical protein